MADGQRRSRAAWPDLADGRVPAEHSHRLPKSSRIIMGGLVVIVVALTVAVGLMAVYVHQQQQYMEGRGEFRDRETARTNERINDAICDLLDQLPEGGLLERPRAKYECGPGIPLAELPVEEAQRLQEQRGGPPPATAPPDRARTSDSPPSPEPPATPPDDPAPDDDAPPARTPAPPPAPPPPEGGDQPPAVDLEPLTDPLCDTAGVCL